MVLIWPIRCCPVPKNRYHSVPKKWTSLAWRSEGSKVAFNVNLNCSFFIHFSMPGCPCRAHARNCCVTLGQNEMLGLPPTSQAKWIRGGQVNENCVPHGMAWHGARQAQACVAWRARKLFLFCWKNKTLCSDWLPIGRTSPGGKQDPLNLQSHDHPLISALTRPSGAI